MVNQNNKKQSGNNQGLKGNAKEAKEVFDDYIYPQLEEDKFIEECNKMESLEKLDTEDGKVVDFRSACYDEEEKIIKKMNEKKAPQKQKQITHNWFTRFVSKFTGK